MDIKNKRLIRGIVNLIFLLITGISGTVLGFVFFGWKFMLVLFLFEWGNNISNGILLNIKINNIIKKGINRLSDGE
jgi:hypothetical protein